jgi:hypothetical protein
MSHQIARYVPVVGDAVETFVQQQATLLDQALMELCWQRIGDIASGAEIPVSASLGAREKACLELAEYFCYSPQSVTDAHVAAVLRHLSAQEVLALATSLWVADASSRLANFVESLDIAEVEP